MHLESDTVKFRAIDSPGDLGEVDRRNLTERLADPFEFVFESEHGHQHFGVRFSRAPDQDTVVSGGQSVEGILAVQAKPDDRGFHSPRTAIWLRRHIERALPSERECR